MLRTFNNDFETLLFCDDVEEGGGKVISVTCGEHHMGGYPFGVWARVTNDDVINYIDELHKKRLRRESTNEP